MAAADFLARPVYLRFPLNRRYASPRGSPAALTRNFVSLLVPRTRATWLQILSDISAKSGGRGGIRTPDTLAGMAVFETARFNRSRTLP